jgi:hypothetical protein
MSTDTLSDLLATSLLVTGEALMSAALAATLYGASQGFDFTNTNALLEWGVAGAVVGVVILFLRHIKSDREDARAYDEKREARQANRDRERDEQFARALQERAHHDAEMIGLLRNTIEAESLHTREAIAALRETVRDSRGNG